VIAQDDERVDRERITALCCGDCFAQTHSPSPLAELTAADYAHRAALGADPVGSNPPYALKRCSLILADGPVSAK
jgi:hypothetical protein